MELVTTRDMNGLPPPILSGVKVHLLAVCHDCKLRHPIVSPVEHFLDRFAEWEYKHPGHNTELVSDRREVPARLPAVNERVFEEANKAPWWLEYGENADIKLAYAPASAAYTLSLASLASSSTLVAGQESDAVVNTTNNYLDYLVGGKIRTGTTVTAGTIEVWAYCAVNDTPTYPDVFDGTGSAETVTSVDIKKACLRMMASIPNDTTNARDYWYSGISIAALHGGLVPSHHGLFVTHSSVAALDSTAGNHVQSYRGVYMTSV